MPSSRNQADWVLLALLATFSVGSGYTTWYGTTQLLPAPASYMIAGAIQVVLFLLLAGLAARHAHVRRWLVVAVFSAASVYTSFFVYYETLKGEVGGAEQVASAQATHSAFVSQHVLPIVEEHAQAAARAAEAESRAEAEKLGESGRRKGYGDRWEESVNTADTERSRVAELKPVADALSALLQQESVNSSPVQLQSLDLRMWRYLPKEVRDSVAAPVLDDYVDAATAVGFLTPYNKVRQRDPVALFALILAIALDGICIILGTVIDQRKLSVAEAVGTMASRSVLDWKNAVATMREAVARPGVPFDGSPPGEADGMQGALEVVRLRLEGRGTDFLKLIYDAIDPETRAIDQNLIRNHTNGTFSLAGRILIDRWASAPIRWVVSPARGSGEPWVLAEDRYDRATRWLADAIEREAEYEYDLAEAKKPIGVRILQLAMPRI